VKHTGVSLRRNNKGLVRTDRCYRGLIAVDGERRWPMHIARVIDSGLDDLLHGPGAVALKGAMGVDKTAASSASPTRPRVS
jgi:hypothetical protein